MHFDYSIVPQQLMTPSQTQARKENLMIAAWSIGGEKHAFIQKKLTIRKEVKYEEPRT